jgi:hypothetical protein
LEANGLRLIQKRHCVKYFFAKIGTEILKPSIKIEAIEGSECTQSRSLTLSTLFFREEAMGRHFLSLIENA